VKFGGGGAEMKVMRRPLLILALAGAGFALPVGTGLATASGAAAVDLPPQSVQVTGKLSSAGAFSFTLQTSGRQVGVLNALTTAADRIDAGDYAYVWGGGHGQAGVASTGSRGGPGYNGKRRGFDCSGAVAAVLAGGGLWPAGESVPNDAGVIRELLRQGLIARGAGVGPQEVTLYDQPGVHIFMNINGRFFGTSDGGRGANARGGPGWLDDGAADVARRAFKRYHFVPAALNAKTNAGYTLAFEFGPGVTLPLGSQIGARVRVVYRTTNAGTMLAQVISLVGSHSTVTTVSPPTTTTTTTTTPTATTPTTTTTAPTVTSPTPAPSSGGQGI
jgi:hypothetical protein